MTTKTCPTCGGSGTKNNSISKGVASNLCSRCGGSGRVTDHSANSAHSGGGTGDRPTCFPSGTQVKTPQGYVPIELLSFNDPVIAKNKRGHAVVRRVIRRNSYAASAVSTITFDDGSRLRATDHHTIKSTDGWCRVRDLQTGCNIFDPTTGDMNAFRSISHIERGTSVEVVYNLIVEGECTFIADGVLAHSFTNFRIVRAAVQRLRYAIGKRIRHAFAPATLIGTGRTIYLSE